MLNPFHMFNVWFKEACLNEESYADAFCLSTISKDGYPQSRIVLLKHYDEKGFVFMTNIESQKGQDIRHNPCVAMNFYWKSLKKQVRIQGRSQLVHEKVADDYFASRPRESKLGAWASKQSSLLEKRSDLDLAIQMYADEFYHEGIPRPPHWSGYCIVPDRFEFWVERPFRLHERTVFVQEDGSWEHFMLYP